MPGVFDENEKVVSDFLETIEQPFTIPDFFKKTGIKKNRRTELNISEIFQVSDFFVFDKGKYYPRSSFLGNIPLRILPTEFEINEGIFLPGHRLLPFHPPWKAADEIMLYIDDSPLETKTMHFKMEDIQIFFTLMDIEKIPILNIEDILEKDAELELNVFDLGDFYRQTNFQPGDSIIVKPVNVHEGIFSLHYDPAENYRTHIFEIKRKDREFFDALKKVMEKKLEFPNAEKQLLYTYFYLKDNSWNIPGTALGPLLHENRDIRFSPLPNGRKVFHFADQDIEDINVYPEFSDFLDMEEEREFDLDSIDGVLEYLNNNNTAVVVRALLLDQIAENKRFDYKSVENYLFEGLEKPYIPKELVSHFKQLVRDEYRALKENFNVAFAFLPVTIARKKILDAALQISKFLRSLDAHFVKLEELPKNDMMQLMELDRSLLDLLYNLEILQLEKQNGSVEGHRVLKIIDRISIELPGVFDLILSKIV